MIVSLDPRGRRTTPNDRSDALEQWLKTMRQLGVDVDVKFETERALLGNAAVLGGHLSALKAGVGMGRPQVINRLARDAGTFEGAVALITALVAGQTPELLASTEDILRRALDRAYLLAADAFASRGDDLLKILSPAHKRIVADITEAYDQIPGGTTGLEQAARRGAADAWIALERACAELDQVQDLLAGWYRDGILKHRGRRPLKDYSPAELMFADYSEVVRIRTDAYRTDEPAIMLTARCVAAGRPALRTTTQVDRAAA